MKTTLKIIKNLYYFSGYGFLFMPLAFIGKNTASCLFGAFFIALNVIFSIGFFIRKSDESRLNKLKNN